MSRKDSTICSKNRKIVPYHGNPSTRNGARLRSPSPIMASVLNANLQQYRTAFEKGIKNVAASFVAWSLSVNNGIYRMLCFVQNVMEGLAPYIL